MRSTRSGWIIALFFVAACGGDDEGPAPTPTADATATAVVATATRTATAASAIPTATAPGATATPPTAAAQPTATPTAPQGDTPTMAATASCSPQSTAAATPTPTARVVCDITPGALPFERTECRATCQHFDPLKQPFFGETHLHTAYSFDASTLDTRNLPPDAYRYAKGEVVGLPPWADTRSGTPTPGYGGPTEVTEFPYCMPGEECQYSATRSQQLPPGRALDFAAVTDHSEQFGENNICQFEGTEPCTCDADCSIRGQICSGNVCVPDGYNADICTGIRLGASRLTASPITTLVAAFENTAENPARPPGVCGVTGERCRQQARLVWQKIIQAAEEAYDRTDACTFTSLIAYEYTAMAANGRCSVDLYPCWDQMGTGEASKDCIGFDDPLVTDKQTCVTDFLGSSGGDNLHRNIIFRNDDVIDQPISNVEGPLECGKGDNCQLKGQVASPEAMLSQLRSLCIDNPLHPRCDVISIPHNSNMSRGSMFVIPETLDQAQVIHDMEPLVELMQIKGQSECRYSPETGIYWSQDPNAPDELCDFENMGFSRLNGSWVPQSEQDKNWLPPRAYVRETLKNGLKYEVEHGVNPFQLGFVGGLDNHNGTPGMSEEIDYASTGAHGIQSFSVSAQALNEKNFLGFETNGGALTVAWAEENSRDSIFTALKNRETYATSGTRPILRFFGGFDLPPDICEQGNFAASGYAGGVPMGGCLERSGESSDGCKTSDGSKAPSFAVNAMMDPGWPGHPGTPLQRVQIIKGWVDAEGTTHDVVYDVAGNPDNGAGVDLKTCTPTGEGAATLCAIWTDPDFDPNEHAFYYARILENPSCRWNQYYCNARGVDCAQPLGTCSSTDPSINGRGCQANGDCGDGGVCVPPLSYTQFEYQQCCGDAVPKTIQQRAWSSPVWYRATGGGS